VQVLRKIIAGVFSLTIVFAMMSGKDSNEKVWADEQESISVSDVGNETEIIQRRNWRYSISEDGFAVLRGYLGKEKIAATPQFIDGIEVRYIASGAFSTGNMTELRISEGIRKIDEQAFWGNYTIKTIVLPQSLEEIGTKAFASSSLEKINIPSGVSVIPEKAFSESALKTVTIADGVTSIGKGAFFGCVNLGTLSIPGTVSEISAEAFSGTKMKEVIIKGDVNSISDKVFARAQIDCITVYQGTKKIEKNAFYMAQIERLNLPSTLEVIEDSAFKNAKINELSVPSGIVEKNAFIGCTMTKVTIDNKKAEIMCGAFSGCDKLENLCVDLEAPVNGSGFNGCMSLKYINGKEVLVLGDEGFLSFDEELSDYVHQNFNATTDVGFINRFIADEVKKVVSSTVTEDMSDIEKVYVLHEWICGKVSFDIEGQLEMRNHVDSAVFMSEYAVCGSYARAFALLMQEAGIEAYYVANEVHAWNIVKLGDHYFHVDASYADYFDPTSYERFLSSDSLWAELYEQWAVYKPSLLYNYDEDVVTPECPYFLGDIDVDGAKTGSDMQIICDYIRGDVQIEEGDRVLGDVDYDGELTLADVAEFKTDLVEVQSDTE